jgi:hypothetical protein
VILGVIYIVAPALIYLVLAALQKGRPVVIGLGIAALLVAALWVMRLARLPPLFTSDPQADGWGMLAIVLWTGAAMMAALVQSLRWLLRMRPGIYAALAAAVFFGGGLFAARMMGL